MRTWKAWPSDGVIRRLVWIRHATEARNCLLRQWKNDPEGDWEEIRATSPLHAQSARTGCWGLGRRVAEEGLLVLSGPGWVLLCTISHHSPLQELWCSAPWRLQCSSDWDGHFSEGTGGKFWQRVCGAVSPYIQSTWQSGDGYLCLGFKGLR